MKLTINKMDKIKDNEVLKQVIKESFGGVMYDVANRNKYNATELLAEWDKLTDSQKASYDGIINGAINFLKS